MSAKRELYQQALLLAQTTVSYNLFGGSISVFFGLEDESLSLFGFGIDSFVEVLSGIGIWHMLSRLKRHHFAEPSRFERRALMTTGTAFFILALGLTVTAILSLYRGHKSKTTFWGYCSLSFDLAMWALAQQHLM
jgi:hypothetical protein